MVLTLVGFGISQAGIAAYFGISEPTLRKHYRSELDTGSVTANIKVANALFKNATTHNNVAAQIFWMKTRAGWRETVDLNHLNNKPADKALDTSKLSAEALAQLVDARINEGPEESEEPDDEAES